VCRLLTKFAFLSTSAAGEKANRQAGKYATNSHSKHARKFLQFAGWIKKGKSWEKSRGDGGGSPRPGDAKPMPSVIE